MEFPVSAPPAIPDSAPPAIPEGDPGIPLRTAMKRGDTRTNFRRLHAMGLSEDTPLFRDKLKREHDVSVITCSQPMCTRGGLTLCGAVLTDLACPAECCRVRGQSQAAGIHRRGLSILAGRIFGADWLHRERAARHEHQPNRKRHERRSRAAGRPV
jgi:hypothetical protein